MSERGIPARALQTAWTFLLAWCLAACSSAPKVTQVVTPNDVWQGRLSIQVASEPPQRISADFFLEGSPSRASLTLDSPLGPRLAHMRWSPDGASLQTGEKTRAFASVDAMMLQGLGTTLPVPALFAWLHGRREVVAGWDLETLDMVQGRIRARSVGRSPAVQIDLVLEAR